MKPTDRKKLLLLESCFVRWNKPEIRCRQLILFPQGALAGYELQYAMWSPASSALVRIKAHSHLRLDHNDC